MALLLALTIGVLYATGIYMILRRSLFKLVLGLALLSHGANLLIFSSGLRFGADGLQRLPPPIINKDSVNLDTHHFADPIPQALILTSIVISFGVLAFALVLFHRGYQTIGSDDPDDLEATDR